ncbi:MAG: hypothetical protein Q3M24_08390 [Candidatus Electrothrix aestuarii]|uniref:Uncharacterized protein n=1 Tax=Candidatus Electrothrix aestuarii TaxID=3062594 RepID=A0AAU8M049_9BACT|nr:hypothetical protein [Candidatus Electrothrix aestuarii]
MKQYTLAVIFWAVLLTAWIPTPGSLADSRTPAWTGTVLLDCDSLDNWSVEADAAGSSGSTELQAGLVSGQSVQLNWNLGSGDWVQGKYTFPAPQDLSVADIFGITLQGGGAFETPNRISIMEYQPAAWIHGHIHEPSNDYLLGKTRVLSNPYGYLEANRVNPDWNEKATVEI